MESEANVPSYSDYLRNYQLAQTKTIQDLLPQLSQILLSRNIARVSAEYDGCGDSGQIETITYYNGAGEQLDGVIEEPTCDSIEQLLYALLELRHGGWENNDGAFGTFEWDVRANTLEHVHNDRYTEVDTSTYEGFGEETAS